MGIGRRLSASGVAVALATSITAGTFASIAPATAPPVAAVTATCADTALASMTESQRIGQLFMVGLKYDQLSSTMRSAIATYHFGSVWFTQKTNVGVTALRTVSNAVQAQATLGGTHHVRFFIAANQEGGYVQALNGPGFDVIPTALTQGTWSTTYLQAKALRWGRQLRAAGVNLDFAPVADTVPPGTDSTNAPIGKLKREFGHYVSVVAPHVAAFIAGMRSAGVATTAKHFPGLGRVKGNTDFASGVTDTVTTRHDAYIQPFARAIGAGVPFVMVSLATYTRIDPSHLAAFSPIVMRTMLRGDLAFHGVVMSDSLSATAVSSIIPGSRAIRFLTAGGDMIVIGPVDQAIAMAKAIASRAAVNSWFRARVNNAALHVLRAKQAAGLLPC
jgi:beta-N-acetylhexosaminidase